MRIVILGHPCLDIIHKNNFEINSYGGIIYSLIGFSLVAKKDDEIIPYFQINSEHYHNYIKPLLNCQTLNLNFIEKTNSDLNVVHLFFEGENLNFECYQKKQPKIPVEKLLNIIPADSNFYINMISGFELELEDLILLRNKFTGKIYFDFHTLTRGIDDNGRRYHRPLENWMGWISSCDVIQMNEFERKSIPPIDLSEEEFANIALESGCKIVNITRGKEGADSYFKENGQIKKLSSKPVGGLKFKSNVGCGDIFGAVFSYNYFSNNQIEFCLKEAVRISSLRTEFQSIDDLLNWKID